MKKEKQFSANAVPYQLHTLTNIFPDTPHSATKTNVFFELPTNCIIILCV